jgi:uncharacterized membrane protein
MVLLRRLHQVAALAFAAALVIQVFLAGAAMAQLGGSGDFATHREFGYTAVGLAWLVLLLTGLAARRPRADIGFVLLLLVLYVVQTVLPSLRSSTPIVAALHPVNALFLFGLSAWYARRTGHIVLA